MFQCAPSLNAIEAHRNLERLFTSGVNSKQFQTDIITLQRRFNTYVAACPTPFIAPGLIVTAEIRRQSEIYLPVVEIAEVFNRLYRAALSGPPILSSTPFYRAMSWADVFVALPARFQLSVNPAGLLQELCADQELLTEFLFASFLPLRFYGGFGRYPEQAEFIRQWLTAKNRKDSVLRCLDAACGTGEDSYGLAALLMEAGFAPDQVQIEGWTLEPLEVWAAAHLSFPHDRRRETAFRKETAQLFERGYQACISFRCADLTEISLNLSVIPPPNLPLERGGTERPMQAPDSPNCVENVAGFFDLILCNGLLGGPIINEPAQLEQVVSNLAGLLAPGGLLLAADSFHGGWKSQFRDVGLKAQFERMGLECGDAGEGIGGVRL